MAKLSRPLTPWRCGTRKLSRSRQADGNAHVVHVTSRRAWIMCDGHVFANLRAAVPGRAFTHADHPFFQIGSGHWALASASHAGRLLLVIVFVLRSAEFLGESDEKPFRPADVAEPIGVFILDYFAYEHTPVGSGTGAVATIHAWRAASMK